MPLLKYEIARSSVCMCIEVEDAQSFSLPSRNSPAGHFAVWAAKNFYRRSADDAKEKRSRIWCVNILNGYENLCMRTKVVSWQFLVYVDL